ncbi:ferrochelatase [Helicobacter sp. 11S02596-1]|uniref:ferrochelatase n=1 Tax=Helicobacter sp. 11S02596-1 TaxID=1476194 RepID=UPI000BD2AFB0|nr:ferrochelatase [Helicobacter sp. 11S02596-1]PAF44860.1 ferrochelatase [Helicobacter sp. 11S02596-1]
MIAPIHSTKKGSRIKTTKEAVLLLNMGGPSNLYEVEVFLNNMFNDPCILSIKNDFLRKLTSNFIVSRRAEKSKKIYAAIGGKSPMTEMTFSLVQKLNQADTTRFYTYAMRYTPPYTHAVLQDLQKQGFDCVVLFSMYPQYSTTTTLSSLNEVYASLKSLDYKPVVKVIDRFYQDEGFNRAIVSEVKRCMHGLDPSEFVMVFSAHGLPESVVAKGDPYQKECEKHVAILSEMLPLAGLMFEKIVLSYQSKVGPLKWIGPSTEEIVQKHKDKKLIIYPLSFSIDNSETKYELCIQYRNLASKVGVKEYIVCPCLNDTQEFVSAILGLVKSMKG